MKKLVYVVTSGSYSDFRVAAVFSTVGKAEEYIVAAKSVNIEINDNIEEYTLDLPKRNYFKTFVRMSKEGDTVDTRIKINDGLRWQKSTFDLKGNLITEVETDDAQKAVKVANERRIQILANNQWGIEVK